MQACEGVMDVAPVRQRAHDGMVPQVSLDVRAAAPSQYRSASCVRPQRGRSDARVMASIVVRIAVGRRGVAVIDGRRVGVVAVGCGRQPQVH
jgi:hypothetical protein